MKNDYVSMESEWNMNRRHFLRGVSATTVVAGGLVLGAPSLFGQDEKEKEAAQRRPTEVETNIEDFMKVPKAPCAIPGPFPGQVIEVRNPKSLVENKVDAKVVKEMIETGITRLTGKNMKKSFELLLKPDDIVGLKVNPVGPPLINTRHEVTRSVIEWLAESGLPKKNIIVWDRFDSSLEQAGYTKKNYPDVEVVGLQALDMEREADAKHVSIDQFDKKAYYYAKGIFGKGVRGYKDDKFYLDQHVFNEEYSYFGNLVTKRLTKIINLPAFKNTGPGISMATKNLGYGAVCNCGRLHQPLFFTVCTEVLAAPWIRDKLVLNINDGLRGQYDGGPGLNTQFVYPNHALYFATDPFALDMICHMELVAKRKAMKVRIDEHPKYTSYLHYAEQLGLGIANPEKIDHIKVTA